MATIVPGRQIEPRSGSAVMLALAKDWVDRCYKNHPECRAAISSNDDPELPSRVIDVGADDGTIRLLISNKRTGKWAALSHRWAAQSRMLRTLHENLDQHKREIRTAQLPATFLDAITVTRAMGLRYLWIDSLCIIQNSNEDWEKESAMMGDIYRRAHVTICAAATEDCLGGIFTERAWVKTSKPAKLQVLTGDGVGTVMFDVDYINRTTPEASDNPLQSRGWCFQESYLSHRLLKFDRLQMSLTCLRGKVEEAFDQIGCTSTKDKNDFLRQCEGPERSPQNIKSIFEIWYKLVEDYTSRNLTVLTDKLEAIAGVASVVNINLKDDYVAGMWRSSPPQALLWRPDREYDGLFKRSFTPYAPSMYRAPSWSWASLEGKVAYPFARWASEEKTISRILDMQCTVPGSNPYGKVTNGYLMIHGPLKRAFCDKSNTWKPSQMSLYRHRRSETGTVKEQFAFCMLDSKPMREGSEIWCLQISTGHGLVLAPVPPSNERYRRIGIFTQNTEERATPENLKWWTEDGESTIVIV